MLIKKFIALLFTGLLMVILGHDIVPHHHHPSHHHSCQDCHQHNSWTDASCEKDLSECCHAFNGMEYFPAKEKIDINKSFRSATGQYISHINQDGPDLACQFILLEPGGPPPVLGRLDASAAGLRGPPCFS